MTVELSTAQSQDAQRAAYDDRTLQADLVLDIACKKAIALIRVGEPGMATFKLGRAAMSAERILGPSVTS